MRLTPLGAPRSRFSPFASLQRRYDLYVEQTVSATSPSVPVEFASIGAPREAIPQSETLSHDLLADLSPENSSKDG